jgi:TPR repeat protein
LLEAAAKTGGGDAFRYFAYCLDAGLGGPRSEPQALCWYRRAAAHGDILAAYTHRLSTGIAVTEQGVFAGCAAP